MIFPFGVTVTRDRRPKIPDPYNPNRLIDGSWDDAVSVTIPDAWIASSSSTSVRDAPREQILTAKSLYCPPDSDVQPGDRIRTAGYTGMVQVRPSADMNPFTGWQPVLEVPLVEANG